MATFSERCKQAMIDLLEQHSFTKNLFDRKEDQAIALAKTVKELQKVPGLGKKIGSLYTNFLISGVGTHLANIASITRLLGEVPAKYIQGGMYDLLRAVNSDKINPHLEGAGGLAEANAFAKGLLISPFKASSEFWYYFQRGIMTGVSSDAPTEYATRTIGGGSVNRLGEFVPSTNLEKNVGKVVEFPSRLAVAIDEGMKAYYRRAKMYEVIEQITNRWSPEQFKAIGQTKESILSHATNAIESGDKDWLKKLKLQAPEVADMVTNYAKEATFQEAPPMFIKRIMQYKDEHPWAAFFAPFVRTPWNIGSQAMDYVPILGIAKHGIKKDEFGKTRFIAPGNEKIGDIVGKQAMGLMSVYTLMAMADSGMITAGYSDDPAIRQKQKDTGVPEFGLKVGDTWVNWGRAEPFATFAILVLERQRKLKELETEYKRAGKSPEILQKFADEGTAIAQGFSKAVVNRQFLYGLSTGLNAALAPDKKLETFAKQFFGGITVPAIVGSVAKSMDPYQRKTDNITDAIKSRLPGIREDLPIDYGTAGTANRNPAYGVAAFAPFVHTIPDQTDLQKFLGELPNYKKGPVGNSLMGVKLDPKQAELLDKVSSEEVGKLLERTYRSIRDNPNMKEPMKAKRMEALTDQGREIARKKVFSQLIKDPVFKAEYLRNKRISQGLE